MNIQQLEYILAVEQFRHFAKAAEHCHVTQPTLSMMIQKLEDELGVKLFDRTTQPVKPTSAGSKVIEQARIVLYQTSLIKDIVKEEEQSLSGTFRLAVLPTIAPYLLPRFFAQLTERYPDLAIRILEMKTAPSPPFSGVRSTLRSLPANRKSLNCKRKPCSMSNSSVMWLREIHCSRNH